MITITHTLVDGTLVDGTSRGDGSAEILKAEKFRWSRNLGQWYVPQSRDRLANRYKIDRASDALRQAGFEVEVSIDNAAEDPAEREARREQRSENRQDALEEKAARKGLDGDAAYQRSNDAVAGIPAGQPILLGHHSQRRHERALDRAHAAMSQSVASRKEAAEVAERARGTERARERRMTPVYLGNRIAEREAEERRIQRNLTTAQRDRERLAEMQSISGAEGDGANGTTALQRKVAWYADLDARLEQVRADLKYFRGKLADLEAEGVRVFTRADVQKGDLVRIRSGWARVVRANPTTVSVQSGYSWTMRYPYTEIKALRRPSEDQSAGSPASGVGG